VRSPGHSPSLATVVCRFYRPGWLPTGRGLPVLQCISAVSRGSARIRSQNSRRERLVRSCQTAPRARRCWCAGYARDERRVDILLWHYRTTCRGPRLTFHLVLTGLAPGLQRQARAWRGIDRTATAFTHEGDAHRPKPTQQESTSCFGHRAMTARAVRIGPPSHDGSVALERHLPLQSLI